MAYSNTNAFENVEQDISSSIERTLAVFTPDIEDAPRLFHDSDSDLLDESEFKMAPIGEVQKVKIKLKMNRMKAN